MVFGIDIINLVYFERAEIAAEKGNFIQADGPEIIIYTVLQPVFFKKPVLVVKYGQVILTSSLYE
jgi:hypothetical protein